MVHPSNAQRSSFRMEETGLVTDSIPSNCLKIQIQLIFDFPP